MTTDELGTKGLAEGEFAKIGEVIVRRGGEHDAATARGLYYAHKDGLSLHQDGRWAKGALRPGMARPASAADLKRADFTGYFDDLASLLLLLS